MTTRRETLKGFALLAATEKLTDGGFAPVSPPGAPEREHFVLPPGACDAEVFRRKCVACGRCMAACPEGIIRASSAPSRFGLPELDFRRGYCLLNCVRCAEACPSGALRFLQREMKTNVHLGYAEWRQDRCLRCTEKEDCQACVRKCPVRAIHLVKGVPVVDRTACIGCGTCEHVCPARPEPAIFVHGYARQRIVNPFSEADLIAEMRSRLADGATLVVAKNGVIGVLENERGLKPLLKAYDAGSLNGAVAVDKVVGRAAAAVYALARAKKVVTPLAAEGAAAICAKAGVELAADKTVPEIRNRKNDGECPLEAAVRGLDDPAGMLSKIRTNIERMNNQ